jgi:hypothetical protein
MLWFKSCSFSVLLILVKLSLTIGIRALRSNQDGGKLQIEKYARTLQEI